MDKALKEVVARIVKEADPDKIILFGSRAKGENRKFSDYDLCVLKKRVIHRRKLAQKIYLSLLKVKAIVPVDVIVETPKRFEELRENPFLVYREIARFGKVVYEKS